MIPITLVKAVRDTIGRTYPPIEYQDEYDTLYYCLNKIIIDHTVHYYKKHLETAESFAFSVYLKFEDYQDYMIKQKYDRHNSD